MLRFPDGWVTGEGEARIAQHVGQSVQVENFHLMSGHVGDETIGGDAVDVAVLLGDLVQRGVQLSTHERRGESGMVRTRDRRAAHITVLLQPGVPRVLLGDILRSLTVHRVHTGLECALLNAALTEHTLGGVSVGDELTDTVTQHPARLAVSGLQNAPRITDLTEDLSTEPKREPQLRTTHPRACYTLARARVDERAVRDDRERRKCHGTGELETHERDHRTGRCRYVILGEQALVEHLVDSACLPVDVDNARHRCRVGVLSIDVHGRHRVVTRRRARVETTVIAAGAGDHKLIRSAVNGFPPALGVEAELFVLDDHLETLHFLRFETSEQATELSGATNTEVLTAGGD